LPLTKTRPIYFAFPAGAAAPQRLIGHLHGICGPPSYSCGKWLGAAAEVGALVCPSGNTFCGDPSAGLASWEAPSWGELVATMDRDLEKSIARVDVAHPGKIKRDGAILTGYSRGAYAAPIVARMHPGRWPYLVLVEADVALTKASLAVSGVRAVALVGGEWSPELPKMKKTEAALVKDGVRARLFIMKKTGHLYSDDIEDVMRKALAFVVLPAE
jgi:hypothetical protein